MQINDFKSVLSTFSDPGSDLLFDKANVIVSVNGDLLEITITLRGGDVFVDDGSGSIPASNWIIKRLAKLPLLAARLKDSVPDATIFVSPAAALLPSLEVGPEETVEQTNDALNSTLSSLDANSPLETTILYITSDAGEGKTFLINQMAKVQAQRFIEGKSDWLLVPIPLGGKHFLRFDDITVGALQNRYRFPFLYYDSFLALVRMGVIVPAFDGFEEMFVENSSGEALSAMGILVAALDSRGSLVVAARKAYFEFEDLKTQERLFDAISTYAVGFGKLELMRWRKQQFLDYCEKRGLAKADIIYERVEDRLGPTHSLLTRPVLVRRLVDLAMESLSLDAFLDGIHASGPDFFSVFVRGIITREANEKWIDRSGEKEVGSPLLTTDEHCELLSAIALATWEARVDFLKRDHLEFVTDFFSESKKKNAFQSQQIRERIRGHALLIVSPNASQAVEFDHEEFKLFFLGEGLADVIKPLNDKAKAEVLAILRRGLLPKPAQYAFIRAVKRHPTFERLQAAKFLLSVGTLDAQASYTQENCSWLTIRLLSEIDGRNIEINNLAFGVDSLRDRKLTNVIFKNCFFPSTSMELSQVKHCQFINCHFTQLRVYNSTVFNDVLFDECEVDSIKLIDRDIEAWDPRSVRRQLAVCGVIVTHKDQQGELSLEDSNELSNGRVDLPLRDIEKIIRYFMRSTHISESVMLMKLGNRARIFLDDELPLLIAVGVLAEIENRGGDIQRRFKLGKTLETINQAILTAQGSYSRFIEACKSNQ